MTTEEGRVPAGGRWKAWGVGLALAAVTVAAYLPVMQCGFVAYDDPTYVTANAVVRSGWNWSGLASAFTSTVGGFWMPLTVLSHMLDCRLFGLNPAAHHAVNLAFHVANVVLLFGLLRTMTGCVWRSAFAAALFALHPLNVESVAWISERKNLLCTSFWLLAMWTYAGYARRPAVWRYLSTMLLTLCAMMSKPMAVTLPLVLFLLDYWPLKRISFASLGKLFLEKVPLLILSLVFSLLTLRTQSSVGAIASSSAYPLIDRLSYAVVNYVLYIDKMIWPGKLSVLYPAWTTPVSLRSLLVCVALLVFVTVVVLRRVRRFPYLTVGWLWYLGTLLPVVGLVMVGYHSIADRFAYIPFIGIAVMVVWGLADAMDEYPQGHRTSVALSVLILAALAWQTTNQLRYWRDSTALFRHAVEVTAGNYVMHENLGRELVAAGKPDEAIAEFAQAVRINSSYLPARVNLAMLLFAQGKKTEALALQSESVGLFPYDAQLLCDAGIMLADAGRRGEAAACLMQALWLNPDLAKAHFRLAVLLLDVGKLDEAHSHLVATVRLMPDSAQAKDLLDRVAAAMKKAKQK
jgi:protein O-mannosyl-transferase